MRPPAPSSRRGALAAALALVALVLAAAPSDSSLIGLAGSRRRTTATHSSRAAAAAAAAAAASSAAAEVAVLRRCMSMTVAAGAFSADGLRWQWPVEREGSAARACGYSTALGSAAAGLALLGRRSCLFIGDSMQRHFFSAAVRALGGDVAPGFWKREGDEWISPLGGRLAWPFMTQTAAHLAGDGPTGLRGAPLAAMGPQDVYVINVGHWDAGQSTRSIPEIVATFAESVPAIAAELRRLGAQTLTPMWTAEGEGGAPRNCSRPLVVWASLNHILPEPYRELVRSDPGRAGHNLDRPERVEAISAYLWQRSGLFPTDEAILGGGAGADAARARDVIAAAAAVGATGNSATPPTALLDLSRLSREGGPAWVSGDLVHGTEEFFSLAWLHLANIIRLNDAACGVEATAEATLAKAAAP
jgi:hypothetical protein